MDIRVFNIYEEKIYFDIINFMGNFCFCTKNLKPAIFKCNPPFFETLPSNF